MSFIRNFSLFAPESLNSIQQSILNTLNWYYEHAYFNGATLTGWHHPSIPRLTGNPITGLANELTRADGQGLSKVVADLAELAKSNPRGMAYCNFMHIPTILLTRPEDITQLMFYNDKHISRGKMIPAFGHIFGKDNLLSIDSNHEWRTRRTELRKAVFQKEALENLAEPMQKIIDERIEELKKDGNVPSLKDFTIKLAMDVLARTQLGSVALGENANTLAEAFDTAMDAACSPFNETRERIALSMLGGCLEYFKIKVNDKLEKERLKLHDVLTKNFFEKNINAEGACLFSINTNLFKKYYDENVDHHKVFKQLIDDIGILLLAGHETSSNLLQFCLLVLCKHPAILEKVREEIQQHKPANDEKWTRKDLMKLDYLWKVIVETLRMYPPFPILPREIVDEVILADIPFCANVQEYKLAMANRDVTKDIRLSPGTAVIIAPIVSHHLESLYKNPDVFDPDRENNISIESLLEMKGIKTPSNSNFFISFGLGPRHCVGLRFAVQEVGFALVRLLKHFNLEADVVVAEGEPKAELMDTVIRNTLQHKGSRVAVKFSPRIEDDALFVNCRKQ